MPQHRFQPYKAPEEGCTCACGPTLQGRLKPCSGRPGHGTNARQLRVAPDEIAMLLHPPPLHLVGVSIAMERESVSRMTVSSGTNSCTP